MTDQGITVDIEEIMKEIKEVAKKLPKEQLADFDNQADFYRKDIEGQGSPIEIMVQLSNEVSYLKANAYNPYYTETGRGLKGIIKRIIRKIVKPIVYPINERQNAYNWHMANVADAIQIKLLNLQDQIEAQSRELAINKWKLSDHLNANTDKSRISDMNCEE